MGETSDSYFDVTTLNGSFLTEVRRKTNNTSVYLNLEASSGGTVTVQILRGKNGTCSETDRCHVVQLGKKYMLWNDVNETGNTYVQLQFTGNLFTRLKGCWSPDSIPESGCSILK
jgi:hypothetical protein